MDLLRISFAGAVLILAIVVIRAVAINRLPKKTFLALWMIALIRLLLPFSIPSPFSIYSLVSRKVSDVEASDTITYEYLHPVFEAVLEEPQNIPAANVPQALPTFPSISIWTLIWIIGMLALALSFLISYLRCRREFKTALPIHNDMITEWLSEHPLKRKIEIRQFSGIITPMTYGLFHPVILLPKNTDWENKQQLRYILFHEYVHICRYDTALKALTATALCIHWFNPMVWVLYILFNRDMELACDECVIRRFGDRPAYARMLISMEERKNRFAPFCNNFSKNAIEERIKSIMKTKKASVITLALACIIVVGTAVFFATSMKVNEISEPVFEAAMFRPLPEKIIMAYTFNGMTSESATEYAARNYPEIDGGYGQSSRAAALVNTVNGEIELGLIGYLEERYSEYFIQASIDQNTGEKSVLSFSGDAVPIDGGERKIIEFKLTIDWNKAIENNGEDFIEFTTKMPYPDQSSDELTPTEIQQLSAEIPSDHPDKKVVIHLGEYGETLSTEYVDWDYEDTVTDPSAPVYEEKETETVAFENGLEITLPPKANYGIIKSVPEEEYAYGNDAVKVLAEIFSGEENFTYPIDSKYNESYLYHGGFNISAAIGENIYSMLDGKVIYSDCANFPFGNAVIIDHGNGNVCIYAFCNDLCVSAGDEVKAGDIIAHVGNTGEVPIGKSELFIYKY